MTENRPIRDEMRFFKDNSRLANAGLFIAYGGIAVMFVGYSYLAIIPRESSGRLGVTGLVFIVIGASLFGIDSMRTKELSGIKWQRQQQQHDNDSSFVAKLYIATMSTAIFAFLCILIVASAVVVLGAIWNELFAI